MRNIISALIGAFVVTACGGDTKGPSSTSDAVLDSVAEDVTAPADTAQAPLPNISEVLGCGAGPQSGPGNSNELLRFPLDLVTFPDALCNDGSGAVLYFRPYSGEENRNKWVINLNGGGSCNSGPSCAARWCWCRSTSGVAGCPFAETTTNFSKGNMETDDRASITGSGITLRGDSSKPNPIGNYNQVRLVYCSSDTWTGTHRASPVTAKHPKTGEELSFSIHFLGARILDASLQTLRRDGVAGPRYTTGTPVELPDLDDASEVILSGDSAGGAGVIDNLDRVADLLRAHNTACAGGGSCPLVVRGLIDAIVGPELARLDYSTSVFAAAGGTTYDLVMQYTEAVPNAVTGSRSDESCRAWHAANAPGTEHRCSDNSHIVRHHITTPFFVRMALLDQLISNSYIDALYSDPVLGILNLTKFAVILQRELLAFPNLASTAEEGASISVAPGVFAPACSNHDTIHEDGEVYGTTITPAGGSPLRLFDVFEAWRSGGSPSAVLTMTQTREDTHCQP